MSCHGIAGNAVVAVVRLAANDGDPEPPMANRMGTWRPANKGDTRAIIQIGNRIFLCRLRAVLPPFRVLGNVAYTAGKLKQVSI